MASYPMNKKRKNFSKLSRAIIDLCTDALRVTLDSHTKPQAIDNKLGNIPNKPKLNARETSLIKDASKVGSYKDFDITLLYYILRCVCNQDIRNYLCKHINPDQLQNTSAFMADLTQDEQKKVQNKLKKVQKITNTRFYGGCDDDLLHKLHMHFCQLAPQRIHPSKGWGKTPDANDTELGDNIERIREIRNSLYGHIPSTEVSDTDFESHWNHLIAIMSGMNTHLLGSRGNKDFKNDLDGIKSSSMDDEMEQFYIDEIRKLAKYEEDLAKRMDEVEITLTDLVEKRKEDNKKIEALSEQTERLAINTDMKHDQLKGQMENVGDKVIQIDDRIQMAENEQMMLQVGQEKLEDGVDGLWNQISNLDTKVQKTVETTTDLKGALETVQEDVATLKEYAEVRRESPRRRKITATEHDSNNSSGSGSRNGDRRNGGTGIVTQKTGATPSTDMLYVREGTGGLMEGASGNTEDILQSVSDLEEERDEIHDILILHADDDRSQAIQFSQDLKTNIDVENLNTVIFEEFAPDIQSKFQTMGVVFERCRYLFVYVTENFTEAVLQRFQSEMALLDSILNAEKRDRVIPVWTYNNADSNLLELSVFVGVNIRAGVMDETFKNTVKNLIRHGRKTHLTS